MSCCVSASAACSTAAVLSPGGCVDEGAAEGLPRSVIKIQAQAVSFQDWEARALELDACCVRRCVDEGATKEPPRSLLPIFKIAHTHQIKTPTHPPTHPHLNTHRSPLACPAPSPPPAHPPPPHPSPAHTPHFSVLLECLLLRMAQFQDRHKHLAGTLGLVMSGGCLAWM